MKQTNIKKRGGFNSPKQQSGYILVVSVILLGAMLIATLSFFEQSSESVQMSGYDRDSAEALLLAESGMNMLYGTFIFGSDINGDGDIDNEVSFYISSPDLLPYMYFVSTVADDRISELAPSILQKIANGEARSGQARASVDVLNNRVPRVSHLLINELYNADSGSRPVLYSLVNNKLTQTNTTWATTRANQQTAAVAWLELIRSTTNGPVEVYVQAAAQVGRSINYVQRFVGSYKTTLGLVSNLNESSTGP